MERESAPAPDQICALTWVAGLYDNKDVDTANTIWRCQATYADPRSNEPHCTAFAELAKDGWSEVVEGSCAYAGLRAFLHQHS
jgi:hypothetical protein